MRKNIFKVFISVVIVIILIIAGLFIYRNSNDIISINLDAIISNEQWALNNIGQKIKDNEGVEGIDINIKKAWEITTGSEEVLVAIIDSGVDISCTGLSDKIYSNGKYNWDFYYSDDSVFDSYFEDYHGTYIANTIAGFDEDNKVYGVAPDVSILPIKFLRGTQGNVDDAIDAIKYACDKGAKIVNISWNFNDYNEELYKVMASNSDVLFVCAAGNSNLNLDIYNIYPACYELDNILTVLAIDNRGKVYNSSGRGNKVDIAAPGVDIITIFPENDVTYVSGTSVASAYVTGVAALMLSVNSSITPKDLIETVVSSAKNIEGLENKCIAGGVIDAYEALKAVNISSTQ